MTSRRFLPLWLAQLTVAFNDQFLKLALITLVTWGGVSVGGMAPEVLVPVAGTLFTAPFFLFSALAGQVADKYDKALVLRRVKQAEVIIMLIAAVGFLISSIPLLLSALALMGAQSAFFSPTRNSALPQWLSEGELVTGNALISAIVSISVLLGQAFGALLIVKSYGPQAAGVILILFALLGWLAIKQAPAALSQNPDLKLNKNIPAEIFHTLKFAYKDQAVFRPMLGTAWYYWMTAGVLILIPTYVEAMLHYDQNVFIFIMVLFTCGALTGAVLCMLLSKGKEATMISAIGALGIALFTFDLYITGGDNGRQTLGTLDDFRADPKSLRFIIDLLGAAISASLFVIPLNAMAQRRANPKHRARLLAAGALLLNAATSIAQMLIALMAFTTLPMHFPFLFFSLVSAIISLYIFRFARKQKRERTI